MKYKHWDDYTEGEKWRIVQREAALETNNSTTKEDLTNMLRFLVDISIYQLIEKFEEELE